MIPIGGPVLGTHLGVILDVDSATGWDVDGSIEVVGASTAVLAADNRNFDNIWPVPTPSPIAVPWLNVTIAMLVVPVVAMLGAGLLTRSRLPIERRL